MQARGCPLVGLSATPDLAAHVRRFTGAGWERADAKDMYAIYNSYIDPRDRSRHAAVAQLRPFFRNEYSKSATRVIDELIFEVSVRRAVC